jgi:hypothetical protein
MKTALKCLTLAVVLLLPATVFAQASLTGTVRDASGGVLPGVTVEAASPALIEKVRTGVTDGSGQYRIVDLQPGTYTLTFTLPGFNVVKREGLQLTGNQTLTIPIDMRVGGLEETITVTGETPVVDVQNATRQLVMSEELIRTIPATRAAGALLNATPGIIVGETGTGGLAHHDRVQRQIEHDQFRLGRRRRAATRLTASRSPLRAAAASRRSSTTPSMPRRSR